MVLKLIVYTRNVISFSYKPKNPVKFRYLESFLAEFSNLAYIWLKISCFDLDNDYNITVTSYLRCWYLFWYV